MKRTLLIFSGLVCVLAFVLPSRVSAQERTVTVQVPANRAWTSTGISLASGQLVQIEATGTVEASSPSDARVFYHQVPPEGRRERHSEKPAPLLPALALLGRIGDGPVLLIGASAQFYAGLPYGTGELQLGINDDLLADNSGSWTVRITVGQGTPPVSSGGQPATPGTTAVSLRGRNGERFSFHCPPNLTAAQVWGTDLYTDDSSICTAAVHAGLITLQHGGAVTIEIRPGAPSYNASSRNGISSGGYGGWSGSMCFSERAEKCETSRRQAIRSVGMRASHHCAGEMDSALAIPVRVTAGREGYGELTSTRTTLRFAPPPCMPD